MEAHIAEELAKPVQESEFHRTFLQNSKDLVDMSRRKMSSYYAVWDDADEVYQGKRKLDKADRAALERREPQKFVVPISYAQIQTFVSFCFSLFTQRERFFELIGVSEEDHQPAKVGEAFLARDLSYNKWEARLYQFLLDLARFGLGVIKTSWIHEKQEVTQNVTTPGFSIFGFQIGGTSSVRRVEATKYLGNKVLNVSPYRFFPDVRLPICRFQEGEFCASEDEYSYTTLRDMEKRGEIIGTEFLKPMSRDITTTRRTSLSQSEIDALNTTTSAQSKGVYILTELQRSIIPSEYLIDGTPLGPEEYPIKYNIWYVNDSRLVKIEPLGYLHNEFTYDVAEFSPDLHNLVNQGLSGVIDLLQSTISWFINSRITSVRKVIQNQLVVDPSGIEMGDLKEREPIIRLKPTAAGRGVDRWVHQLQLQDVTQNHIGDSKYLHDLVQITTGINDNLLGQFHVGRRSATEARNVTSGAAARLKMIALLVFKTALEPMGRKMLSNLRDGLDEETAVRLVGMDGPSFIKADKAMLVGDYDFEVFDGTLPSEKGQLAQTLENTLIGLMKAPQAAIVLQLDPKKIFMEALELRGIRNPERFTLRAPAPGEVLPLQQPQLQQPELENAGPELSNIIQG